MAKALTTGTIKEIIRLYQEEKMKTQEIADKLGISRESVRAYLRNANIEIKYTHYRKFYKNKYLIALYDMDGNLFRLFDNSNEFAIFMGRKNRDVLRDLGDKFINRKLRYKGKWYSKVLIEENNHEF
jgi:transposase